MMSSPFFKPGRCALYAALMEPESRRYALASVDEIGAGSSPRDALSVSVPEDGASGGERASPKAVYVRLNLCARCLRAWVSRDVVAPTELSVCQDSSSQI